MKTILVKYRVNQASGSGQWKVEKLTIRNGDSIQDTIAGFKDMINDKYDDGGKLHRGVDIRRIRSKKGMKGN